MLIFSLLLSTDNVRDFPKIPEVMSNSNSIAHTNFAETVVHSGGDLTISVRRKEVADACNPENGSGEYLSSNNRLDESDESDSGSSIDTDKPMERPACQPFSLLPPGTVPLTYF